MKFLKLHFISGHRISEEQEDTRNGATDRDQNNKGKVDE